MSPPDKFKSAFAALKGASSDVRTPDTSRHLGRPPGKRSNPAYRQVTGWIRRDVARAVQIRMLETGRDRDLGPLLEELLTRWLTDTSAR